MVLSAELYNESNYQLIVEANALIDKIISEYKGSDIEVIVDIGCGTGNISRILFTRLSPKVLIALDIDEESIEFAKQHNSVPGIHFITQDICKNWSEWHPFLKRFESKVSLVFCNFVLSIIEDTGKVIENINRLLSPQSKFYLNNPLVPNLFEYLTAEEAADSIRSIAEIPSVEQQIQELIQMCANFGFDCNYAKLHTIKLALHENLLIFPAMMCTVRMKAFIENNEQKMSEEKWESRKARINQLAMRWLTKYQISSGAEQKLFEVFPFYYVMTFFTKKIAKV